MTANCLSGWIIGQYETPSLDDLSIGEEFPKEAVPVRRPLDRLVSRFVVPVPPSLPEVLGGGRNLLVVDHGSAD